VIGTSSPASRSSTARRLVDAAGFRHGVVHPPRVVRRTFAEPPGIVNVAVPDWGGGTWRSASGGIARTAQAAEDAAVAEALERYAAHACSLPRRTRAELDGHEVLELEDWSLYSDEQRGSPDFPYAAHYDGPRTYTNVFDLASNRELWVPFELVGLSAEGAGVSTSNGLAAGRSPIQALLRAVQELVERDALMSTWLHGVPGLRVEPLPRHRAEVEALGGEIACIDATPAYSPHPVALVAGRLPLRGAPRFALGAACRATWHEAAEKAYLEWLQGVVFVAVYREFHPGLAFPSPLDVKSFDEHAVYYSVCPDEWERIPLLRGHAGPTPPAGEDSLEAVVSALHEAGIRIFYRELTTADVRQAGVHAVRALSPDLAPIHCDQAWPFLGGTVPDVRRRYPWADPATLTFPSPFPHPLG
jgi:ribosomal protein S12 methylthiotransferase accessory factor